MCVNIRVVISFSGGSFSDAQATAVSERHPVLSVMECFLKGKGSWACSIQTEKEDRSNFLPESSLQRSRVLIWAVIYSKASERLVTFGILVSEMKTSYRQVKQVRPQGSCWSSLRNTGLMTSRGLDAQTGFWEPKCTLRKCSFRCIETLQTLPMQQNIQTAENRKSPRVWGEGS